MKPRNLSKQPILAVIPAHQEAPRIADVVRAAAAHLPVLVVDDGSTDATADVARSAGATVLTQHPNAGKGAALRAGFMRAIERGCVAVVTLDADGQHDPAEIPAFLAAHHRGSQAVAPDLVIGTRAFREMPFVRRLANTLGRWTFSWAVGRDIPDNQSGYRLISRRLIELVIDSHESGFEFEVEMITTALRAGMTIDWIPIRTIYAGEPSHIRAWDHVTNFLRVARVARRSVRQPLPEPQEPRP